MVDGGKALECFIVRDRESKAVFGHLVPVKGVDADGYSTARGVEGVKWLGYTKLLLKSDNEPSILNLASTALRVLRVDANIDLVSEELPHRYESQSNGATGVAVRELRGQYRTLKGCLGLRFQHGINQPILCRCG